MSLEGMGNMVQLKVCSLEVVPVGSMKQFYAGDLEVIVINSNGQFFCLDGRCTHAGAPLAEGTLKGEVLTCPWHGSQFNIKDGSVIRGPAEKTLRAYITLVKDNFLFIEV
jgi:nitrite reductase/ring-hydroxylating ferredoxin subunit